MIDNWDLEEEARRIVERISGLRFVDNRSSNGGADYVTESQEVRLEVTRATIEELEAAYRYPNDHPSTRLAARWFVSCKRGSRMREVAVAADNLAFAIENNEETSELEATFQKRGGGYLTTGAGPAGVFLHPPVFGGFPSSEALSTAIERQANKSDNRRKLANAVGHLFVWIEVFEHSAWIALEDGSLPTTFRLPPEVDELWVGRMRNSYPLIRSTASDGHSKIRLIASDPDT